MRKQHPIIHATFKHAVGVSAEELPDERRATAAAFLARALAFFAGYGVKVQRLHHWRTRQGLW